VSALGGFFWSVVCFLAVIGPLIFIHEMGHYLVGCWCGVKAEVFSIGFGKELFGWTDKRGTRWKVSALPMGGYVKFAGDMNPASQPSPDWLALPANERRQTFQAKPVWQRFLIVFAGPATNFLFAFLVIAAVIAVFGMRLTPPVISGVTPGTPAAAAGLRAGDRIEAIAGHSVQGYEDVGQYVFMHPDANADLLVDRGGNPVTLNVHIRGEVQSDGLGGQARMGLLDVDVAPSVVATVLPGSAAAKAGLKAGDRITAIAGQPIGGFAELADYTRAHPGALVTIDIVRDGLPQSLPITIGRQPGATPGDKPIGMLGVGQPQGEQIRIPLLRIPERSASLVVDAVRSTFTVIGQMIGGTRSASELHGPVAVARAAGQQVSLGWFAVVLLMAGISINLGFINLLPIPMLDGGHLLFYIVEAIRRKPVEPQVQEWAFRSGLALILGLMLFVTFNDLGAAGLWQKLTGLIG
jgi:regulator of sigma E protease